MTGLHPGLRSTRNRTATHRFATRASLHASESERRRMKERLMALLSHQPAETVSAAAPRPNALVAKAVQGNILNVGR